jgi:hypothetical protein
MDELTKNDLLSGYFLEAKQQNPTKTRKREGRIMYLYMRESEIEREKIKKKRERKHRSITWKNPVLDLFFGVCGKRWDFL